MLLEKQIRILVFKIDNTTFENIGEINQFDSLIWPDKFNGYASFELWAPITDENSEYLKQGNVLWCGGDNAAVIEIIKSSVDDDGIKTFNVKGRTLEVLLTTRIIWGTYVASNQYASDIMYNIVDKNCISTSSNRKIPYLECSEDDTQCGNIITIQKTGGEVYETLSSIASDSDIGFNILFRPREKRLIFEVVSGADRTETSLYPIVFSTDLEDILTSSYYTNNQDKKTVALVMGEDKGTNRKKEISGISSGSGFDRRELYVDARDVQSEIRNDDGSSSTMTDEEYKKALIMRGDEKLALCKTTETFEAKIRVFGESQYEFGKDYYKGDKVTVIDKQLNVSVSARITEVEEDFGDKYELLLTFGYSYPTIMQKVKNQIL